MVEHWQNLLKHKSNNDGWNQLFRIGEEDVRLVVAPHNIKEDVAPVQEVGEGLFWPFLESLDMNNSGKDKSGLGRWTMMVVQQGNGMNKGGVWLQPMQTKPFKW